MSFTVFVLLAAALVFLGSADTTQAATYNPTGGYFLENCLPNGFPTSKPPLPPDVPDPLLGVPATPPCNVRSAPTSTVVDTTVKFDIAAPDSFFDGAVITLGDPAFTVADDAAISPDGQKIGALATLMTQGLVNGACLTSVPVDFILYESSVSGSLASNPVGTPDRWSSPGESGSGGGLGTGYVKDDEFAGLGNDLADADSPFVGTMPDIYGPLFDPDLDYVGGPNGPLPPITPKSRYTGATRVPQVTGDWYLISVLNFDAGDLQPFADDPDNFPSPFAHVGATDWNVSMILLNDVTTGITYPSTSPSTIVDFCSSWTSDLTLLGTSSGSDTRFTTPATAGQYEFYQYSTGRRDADGDGIENQFDTCPFVANVGDSRLPTSPVNGDADIDGIDDACDVAATAGVLDVDGDGFNNRHDGCPQIADAGQTNSELLTTYLLAAPDGGPRSDGITDACDPNDFDATTEGAFGTDTNVMPVCITGGANVDANGDGICDNTAGTYSPDSDFDGYTDAAEGTIGTDPLDNCADTATANDEAPDPYPADFDDNRIVNIIDLLTLLPVFGTASPRHDLNVDGLVNVPDAAQLALPIFASDCPNYRPGPVTGTTNKIAIDMDTTLNAARTVGPSDICGVIDSGGTNTIDIDVVLPAPGVNAADGIEAFEFTLNYDQTVVKVTAEDQNYLLTQAAGSVTAGFSDVLPDTDGSWRSAVLDPIGDVDPEPASTAEIGPGVLTRITLTGVAAGTTTLQLTGVYLIAGSNASMPVTTVSNATVSVDEVCVPSNDVDSDGVEDSIDNAPASFSNDFADGASPVTSGTITARNGASFLITDAPDGAVDPKDRGVLVTVTSGGPVVIDYCGTLTASVSGTALLTCGSAWATAVSGSLSLNATGMPATVTPVSAVNFTGALGTYDVFVHPLSQFPVVIGGLSIPPGSTVTGVTDTDSDGLVDQVDNCPTVFTVWVVPPGDGDCDFWTDADEGSIGTDPSVDCDDDLGLPDWPPDFDNTKNVNIVDVFALKPVFNTSTGAPNFTSPRFDLAPSGTIDIVDVFKLKPVFNTFCT